MSDCANYGRLSYGQLHELFKQRGYYGKDTKAVLRTRLAAIDAADKKEVEGSSSDIDTSTSVLGKRTRTLGGTMEIRTAVARNDEKRPRSEALELKLAGFLEAAKEHAQWWNPELRPHVEAHQSSAV